MSDAQVACVEKCVFEPLFAAPTGCQRLDLACICQSELPNAIYGCLQGSCGSYSAEIDASAASYCSVAITDAPRQGGNTVTVTANGGGGASYYTYTSISTTTVTTISAGGTVTITGAASTSSPSDGPDALCGSEGLATGAVAGIAVGCLLIGIATALVAACLFFRRRNKKSRRDHIPEIQQPSVAHRAGGTGPAASPLLAPPPQHADRGYAPTSNIAGYSNRNAHGVPTVVSGGSSDGRLGSPAPSYSPDQPFNTPYNLPPKGNGLAYSDQGVVEHDGRERGYLQNR